ncbi:ATP-binding protein [Hydrococcus rivularis NIES-593]|uniref:ATP-binding protein n=1 Tax=Hydrococcus rivularis NIES-593 TaxID=1921803 RepID=A0A1U7HT92_9CYAN|nr:ATP-binding protein [Hydrococcus rivularis]OKH26813.1 ATP-binding protein [Hydrococcus rivularis NIES-593]
MVISPSDLQTETSVTISNISAPLDLFGRQVQFQQITQALALDRDVLIAGVPGSGRRTLVRRAAAAVGAKMIEVDCIRATDSKRFVQLLCEGISQGCKSPESIALLHKWVEEEKDLFSLKEDGKSIKLRQSETVEQLWQAFKSLLCLPHRLATSLDKRVVLILYGFSHIRAWDRQGEWETLLREEIKRQTAVSYVLVATIAETSHPTEAIGKNLEIIQLTPVANEVVAAWAQEVLNQEGLAFDPRSQALDTFLDAVQGHIADATALIGRLRAVRVSQKLIGNAEIEQAIQALLADLSTTFESLLVLLPPSQAQLLESLALDPTDKPQSRDYISKHCLCRGGSLQGAIAGLQHKGLIYGSELDYRLALPLFALWIRQRLS